MKQHPFWIIGMTLGLLSVGSYAFAASWSPTAITIEQAVHFVTPGGSDVIVEPGTYKMEAKGERLSLTSTEDQAPIEIQAGAAPFPEQVESPVALAIPIPDEGIYLALAVPGEAGLEAMGSYSGIQTRGRGILKLRKSFSPKYRRSLNSFAQQLTNNPKAPDLKRKWNQLVQRGKTPQLQGSTNEKAAVVSVLRTTIAAIQEDLRALAAKLQDNLDQKKKLREEIADLKGFISSIPPDFAGTLEYDDGRYTKAQLEALLQDLESKLQTQADIGQQLQRRLQDAMQKQQQAMQTLSAIFNAHRDTQKKIIDNLRP